MSISMYQASVPYLIRTLENMSAVLAKGAAYAEAKKVDALVLTGSRLYLDMLPLTKQIQIATDGAKGCAARLAGVEAPKFDDTETSFAELETRLRKTIDYLKTFKPEQIDGSEKKIVTMQVRSGAMTFEGQRYLFDFVIPNVTFHAVTAYNILRSNGVDIGKQDYLGRS